MTLWHPKNLSNGFKHSREGKSHSFVSFACHGSQGIGTAWSRILRQSELESSQTWAHQTNPELNPMPIFWPLSLALPPSQELGEEQHDCDPILSSQLLKKRLDLVSHLSIS